MNTYDEYRITYSGSHGYPTIHVNGKNVLLHRYVWMKYHGEIPDGYEVHHIDGNRSNWNIENLKLIQKGDHQRIHALKNGLGKSNKGKAKKYQSGCVPKAHAVKLVKDDTEIVFQSMGDAVKYLGLKSASSICNVLAGRCETAKGWHVYEVSI